MEKQVKFGLLGRNISYSFSQKYFTEKFQKLGLSNHHYEVFDLKTIDEVLKIFEDESVIGFNVTIPYKEKIIPFLDKLSPEAEKIGAVNVVKIEKGKAVGYNTDAFGFEQTLLLHRKEHQKKALILGNGGASKAVKFVLEKHNIPYLVVARALKLNFETLSKEIVSEHPIIVQCTPVGTFPNVEDCLKFPFEGLTINHLLIDLIYNPSETKLMKMASERGAKSVNGYYMLEQQAEKAWEIWKY